MSGGVGPITRRRAARCALSKMGCAFHSRTSGRHLSATWLICCSASSWCQVLPQARHRYNAPRRKGSGEPKALRSGVRGVKESARAVLLQLKLISCPAWQTLHFADDPTLEVRIDTFQHVSL